jgi:hypothetical protein
MKHVSWYLVVTMFIIGIAPKVDARFSPSEIINLTKGERCRSQKFRKPRDEGGE